MGNIVDELKSRLGKAAGEGLIPKVAYSPVAFNVGQVTKWSSPWRQAFQLLKGIAEFPRAAMTNKFFGQGVRTDEDAVIKAMDVAGDHLVAEYGGRKAKQRAAQELAILKDLEASAAEARDRCAALWTLLTAGDDTGSQQAAGRRRGSKGQCREGSGQIAGRSPPRWLLSRPASSLNSAAKAGRHLVPTMLAGDDEHTVVQCAAGLRSCGPRNDGARAPCSWVARSSRQRRAKVCHQVRWMAHRGYFREAAVSQAIAGHE